jgi:hypothetical protein
MVIVNLEFIEMNVELVHNAIGALLRGRPSFAGPVKKEVEEPAQTPATFSEETLCDKPPRRIRCHA